MDILTAIPAIGQLINKFVPDANAKKELELELQKLEAQETQARMGVLSAMMGNKSFFVAGGIPALIWLAVVYLAANYILFPLLAGFGMNITPINLPDAYWTLLEVIVVGLFGKKVIDGNEWRWGDKLISPGKAQVQIAAAKGETVPVGAQKYDTQEAIDKRFEELKEQYGLKN